ncbi:hypothetical protein, partial [Pseudomonas sp. FW305-33]|uniref:hypothetical protein n=1 Tax=Pseudomonas sp. FW305-33 TaxID=2751337 RepID=UPI001C451C98
MPIFAPVGIVMDTGKSEVEATNNSGNTNKLNQSAEASLVMDTRPTAGRVKHLNVGLKENESPHDEA